MTEPIFITGCARSGTSLTAGVIHYCGAFGGVLSGATKNNKKGMFENHEIRETVIKPILRKHNFDPMGQDPLPDINVFYRESDAVKLREQIQGVMKKQGWKEGEKWFYKGAKMCLMFPLFHRAFPKAKWIIVRRDDAGIVNSCLKTGFMSKYRDAKGWQGWVDIHKLRFKEMRKAGLNIRETYPRIWWRETLVL